MSFNGISVRKPLRSLGFAYVGDDKTGSLLSDLPLIQKDLNAWADSITRRGGNPRNSRVIFVAEKIINAGANGADVRLNETELQATNDDLYQFGEWIINDLKGDPNNSPTIHWVSRVLANPRAAGSVLPGGQQPGGEFPASGGGSGTMDWIKENKWYVAGGVGIAAILAYKFFGRKHA